MATREAALKVTLKPGAFKAGLRKMTSMTSTAGTKMGRALKEPLKDGFKAAGGAAKQMLGSLTDAVKMAASLGGAFSVGAAIKGAVESEEAYLRLSMTLSDLGDKAVTASEAQAMVGRAAKKTKVDLAELQIIAAQLANVGADRFENALERSAAQAHRLGAEGQILAEVYSVLFAKGLVKTGDEAEITTERLVRLGRVGLGLNLQDALNPADIAEFAAFTNRAGKGLESMLNMIEAVGGGGVKDLGELNELVEEFSEVLGTTKGFEEIRKGAKLSTEEFKATGSSVENFIELTEIGGKKGQKALASVFDAFGSGKAQTLLENLFGKELVLQIRRGKADQEDIDEAANALKAVLDKRTDTEETRKGIAEKDAKFQDTNAARMRTAMNDLHKAFASPEMIAAVTDLTKLLPDLVAGLTDLLKLVAENPKEALAAIVLGQVGMVFAGAAVKSAAAAGVTALMAKLGIATAASTAATAAAAGGGAAAAGGGAAAAATGLTTVAAAGAATVAALTVGAAAVGVAIGAVADELVVKPAQQNEADAMTKASMVAAQSETAMTSDSRTEINAALVEILQAQAGLKNSETSFNTIFGNIADALGPPSIQGPAELRQKSMEQLSVQEDRLRKHLETLGAAADTASKALRGTGGGGAAGAPGGNSTRGPRVPANPQPGASPVGG